MYDIRNESEAIREVQKYLHTISDRREPDIPRVAVDGVWTDETEAAIAAFKRIYGLPDTPGVDLEVFELLYALYAAETADMAASDYLVSDSGFPLNVGDQNADVIILHAMLSELKGEYTDIGRIDKSNYYSVRTADAIRDMQRIFGLELTGITDKYLFKRLSDELEFIRAMNEVYEF